MKIQISNQSHRPAKRYSGVYQQQGRMITDADWNELVAIIKGRQDAALQDAVGLSGSPVDSGVLRDERLTFGRVYADGLLAEIREKEHRDALPKAQWAENLYINQQDFAGPALPTLEQDKRRPTLKEEFWLYADVWERLVTSLEDEDLLDPGLHGADTCARTQTLAQVKWCPAHIDPSDDATNPRQGDAVFKLVVNDPDRAVDPCRKDPADFELITRNYLFRLEVHDVELASFGPRQVEKLTLKWSMENGAEAHSLNNVPPYFKQSEGDKAYEFFSDATEQQLGWHLVPAYKPPRGDLFYRYPDSGDLPTDRDKVRRWDGYCHLKKVGGNWSVAEGTEEPGDPQAFGGVVSGGQNGAAITILVSKLTVTLELKDKILVAGDYWLARVREHQTEPEPPVRVLSSTPVGIVHRYVVLGKVTRAAASLGGFTDTLQLPDKPADRDAYIRRLSFPPLTDIPADHVGYDPDEKHYRWKNLDLGWPEEPFNAQDAIDQLVEGLQAKHIDYEIPGCNADPSQLMHSVIGSLNLPASGSSVKVEAVLNALLCRQRELPFHNKHLHGWGIVCGLQVHCGPDAKPSKPTKPTKPSKPSKPGIAAAHRQVTIQKGYALDCEGRDLILDAPIDRDLIGMIEVHEQSPGVAILDDDGNGTVCLTLASQGHPVIGIEPYVSAERPRFLSRTVWGDLYDECVKQPLETARNVIVNSPFDDDDPKALDLISPMKKRLATGLNLFGQLLWPDDGQYVFLSEKEHKDLKAVYVELRLLLRSKTFCGMYQGNEFPAYPFPGTGLSTIFGDGFHTRLRLHPGGQYAYTCGGEDGMIHVYDLKQRAMVAALEIPDSAGASVKDVAFSQSGESLYAIASLGGVDTIFCTADIKGGTHKWAPITVLSDIELVTLANASDNSDELYAIGLGDGLFVLNPDDLLGGVKSRPAPKFVFNATGQMTSSGPWFFAAAGPDGGQTSSTYDRIISMQPSTAQGDELPPPNTKELYVGQMANIKATGDDDLVYAFAEKTPDSGPVNRLYVVVDKLGGVQGKLLLGFGVDGGVFTQLEIFFELQDTRARLGFHSQAGKVLATMADGFRMQIIDIHTHDVTVPRHPVQLSPVAVSVFGKSTTYVLNGFSNTISVIPDKLLLATDEEFLKKLRVYREQVLGVYLQLVGGLLQFVKDCFCDRLLVDCPDCEDTTIYLACVEIKDRKVYRVCNFSKRKYVKSFPTVEHWLSVVPVIPLIKEEIQKLCCSILPDWFDNLAAANKHSAAVGGAEPLVNVETLYEVVKAITQTDFRASADAMKKSAGVYRQLGLDAVMNRVAGPSRVGRSVGKSLYVGKPTSNVREHLEKRGIIVEAVEPYKRAESTTRITDFLKVPPQLTPGTKVKIYERAGKVLFYAPVEEPPVGATEITAELLSELDALERRKAALGDMSEISAEVGRMVEEASSLRTTMAELEETRQRLALDIARERPVRVLPGVTPSIDERLRDLDIRTVEELASAKAETLADAGTGISQHKAIALIASAKERLR